MNKNRNKLKQIVIILAYIAIIAVGAFFSIREESQTDYSEISNIPEYSGEVYVEINNNIPEFTSEDINIAEDYYSNLKNGRVRNGNGKN